MADDWRNAPPPKQTPPAQQPQPHTQPYAPPAQPQVPMRLPKEPTSPAIALLITVVVGGLAAALLQLGEDDDAGLSILVTAVAGVVAFVFAVAAGVEYGMKRAKYHERTNYPR